MHALRKENARLRKAEELHQSRLRELEQRDAQTGVAAQQHQQQLAVLQQQHAHQMRQAQQAHSQAIQQLQGARGEVFEALVVSSNLVANSSRQLNNAGSPSYMATLQTRDSELLDVRGDKALPRGATLGFALARARLLTSAASTTAKLSATRSQRSANAHTVLLSALWHPGRWSAMYPIARSPLT